MSNPPNCEAYVVIKFLITEEVFGVKFIIRFTCMHRLSALMKGIWNSQQNTNITFMWFIHRFSCMHTHSLGRQKTVSNFSMKWQHTSKTTRVDWQFNVPSPRSSKWWVSVQWVPCELTNIHLKNHIKAALNFFICMNGKVIWWAIGKNTDWRLKLNLFLDAENEDTMEGFPLVPHWKS